MDSTSVMRGPNDPILLVVVFMLLSLGLMSIYSGSALDALFETDGRSSTAYLRNQGICIAFGLGLMIAVSRVDYYQFWVWRKAVVLSSLLGLCLVFVPGLGLTRNNSTRWIDIGFANFQPAEWAKIAVPIYLAYSIKRRGAAISEVWHSFGVHFCILTIYVSLLMLQPDMGSSVLLSSLVLTMLFLGGTRGHVFAGAALCGVVGLIAGVSMGGYRLARFEAWLDPWAHADGVAYQLVNSLVALASGGLDGVGIGQGRGRLGYIPELHTDFIASGIGEEFGFMGMSALIVLYVMFLWRGVHIALRARDRFGYLLAMGLTFVVVFQAAMNLGVVTGVLPTKGLTLPLVSYGRSSLVMTLFGIGILLNISQRNPNVRAESQQAERESIAEASRIAKTQRVQQRRATRALSIVDDVEVVE
jgi:cell division protein FtsW